MRFSVVIPLYNKERYVTRAVESVLAQTSRDFEIIVVDDGSTDGGASLVERTFGSRLRVVRQENQGVSAARNRGIAESKSGMIAFLDADDAWSPDFLEAMERLIKSHPQAGAYAAAYDVVTRLGYRRKATFRGIDQRPWEGVIPGYFKASALGEPPVSSSSVAIPKKVFEDVGYFSLNERYGEDLDMWGRIALRYPIVFTTEVKATHYQNASDRKSVYPKIDKDWGFVVTARHAVKKGAVPAKELFFLLEYLAFCQLIRARSCILSGNRAFARKLLSETDTALFVRRKLFWSVLLYVPKSMLHLLIKVKEWAQFLHAISRSPGDDSGNGNTTGEKKRHQCAPFD